MGGGSVDRYFLSFATCYHRPNDGPSILVSERISNKRVDLNLIMDTSKQPGIQIDQVLLLGAKFAHRADALSLPSNTPIRDLPFQVEAKIAGKAGDPIVAFRLRAFTGDNTETLYTFDVEIAAVISRVVGEENLDPFEYAQDIGPAAFYPFLREAIANITLKGRFGPIWLKPVNLTAAASSAPVEATEAVEA